MMHSLAKRLARHVDATNGLPLLLLPYALSRRDELQHPISKIRQCLGSEFRALPALVVNDNR